MSLRSFLASYFDPRTNGALSAYRAGAPVHMFFSVLVAQVGWALLHTVTELHWVPIVLSVFAAIVLLWGIGVAIGGASHYSCSVTLVILVLVVVVTWRYPDEAVLGGATGLLSHGVVTGAILILRRGA